MAGEEVIEKARLAFIEAWERKAVEQEETGRTPGERSRAGIEAAFAVFRESEPSDAQVEAAARALGNLHSLAWSYMSESDREWERGDARAALRAAAGVR